MSIKIITWNMAYGPPRFGSKRSEAWNYIKKIKPDFALLQEAIPIDEFSEKYNVNFQEIPNSHGWGNVILSKTEYLYRKIEFKNVYDGYKALLCYEYELNNNLKLVLINLYGKKVENEFYSTTLHHMISDISSLIYKNKNMVILAGDFNATEQFDNIHKNEYPSDRIVFDRLEDLGLINCTKRQFGSHIETHFQNNIPWQDDYIFMNDKYYNKENCIITLHSKNEIYELSDHNLLELNINI